MKKLTLPLDPATAARLEAVGPLLEPLFSVEEPEVSRDARSLYRRLAPQITTSQRLLSSVNRLGDSLLASLDRLAPKHDGPRRALAAAWAEVERSIEG